MCIGVEGRGHFGGAEICKSLSGCESASRPKTSNGAGCQNASLSPPSPSPRLNIQPPDLFFYAFLPPLLVDSAIRIDFFMFKKVRRGLCGAALVCMFTGLILAPRGHEISTAPLAMPPAPWP